MEKVEICAECGKALAESLAYAIHSEVKTSELTGSLIVSEFWHSLNRRKIVVNENVDTYIAMTLDRLEELRKTRRI